MRNNFQSDLLITPLNLFSTSFNCRISSTLAPPASGIQNFGTLAVNHLITITIRNYRLNYARHRNYPKCNIPRFCLVINIGPLAYSLQMLFSRFGTMGCEARNASILGWNSVDEKCGFSYWTTVTREGVDIERLASVTSDLINEKNVLLK